MDPLELLASGEVEVLGRMPYSSNATLLTAVRVDGTAEGLAVYKPGRGERPLWDFPPDIYVRERAAYLLSEALAWRLVPPTVVRDDAPLGPGSLQLFIEADFEEHYFTLIEDERYHDALRTICTFDLLANNTDRKSGHCLVDGDGHVWAVDNALCFSSQPKLRTVIWEFGGEAIPDRLLGDVERLVADGVPSDLAGVLDSRERAALLRRARSVLTKPCFPIDRSGHRYPWPLV
ncbi:MAG: SCO1664 family protein [Acidimicrobiales bacterium]